MEEAMPQHLPTGVQQKQQQLTVLQVLQISRIDLPKAHAAAPARMNNAADTTAVRVLQRLLTSY
jgi:hypothetical protein